MYFSYKPHGVCSREINIELDGDVVKKIEVIGGCNGNLKGICSLVEEMKAEDVIKKFSGIRCGMKATSCPDQIAKALTQALAQQNN